MFFYLCVLGSDTTALDNVLVRVLPLLIVMSVLCLLLLTHIVPLRGWYTKLNHTKPSAMHFSLEIA